MALQDKITAYFDRDPRLHVLFVFDSDISQSFTLELQEIKWPDGYRFVIFDELSWLGTKYAIENDWKDEKVILVFHRMSPNVTASAETFPLMGLLSANAEYKSQSYEQFMQHHNIPAEYADIVRRHINEFDREKFAKLLRPYFNATDFRPEVIYRGIISGYMNESKILSWDEILLRLIQWEGSDDNAKRSEQFYNQLSANNDIAQALQAYLTDIFGFGISLTAMPPRTKKFAESMKYNSIVQLLPNNPADNYNSLRISDSLKLDKLNRLMEATRMLPRQRRDAFAEAFAQLSTDIKESEILRVYGANADYYQISAEMADALIASIVETQLEEDPKETLSRLASLRYKVEDYSDINLSLEYALTLARFYEKASRLGSVVYDTTDEYIAKYTSDLYLFDLYYRTSIAQFHDLNDALGCYTALETAKQKLDREYARIANKINTEWVRCLKEKGNGYAEITSAIRQENLFKETYDSNVKQAFIICDAFRYELAKELVEKFASNNSRYIPELKPGIAMLPTETKYCKSALLPHENLDIHDLTLSVDYKILNDTPSREAHVKSLYPDARFVDFGTVLSGNKETLRQIFTGPRLFFLFFDDVDHIGHGSNPRHVVNTCAEAVEEMAKVIAKIHDHGNVAHVYLTSDHGFLYNDMTFEDRDKLDVNDSDLEKKSRYYLTLSDANITGITKFPIENVSGTTARMLVAVPDGTNRIKVRGGDYNFAHGGASLQEVIIPVLHTYAPRTNTKVPTGVTLLGHNHSVVSSRLRVQLFQDEAVSETIKERQVSVALYDGDRMVSNEVIKTLASTNADQAQARIFDFDLTLMQSGTNILKLKVLDVDNDTSRLNPLVNVTVTNNTLIDRDF